MGAFALTPASTFKAPVTIQRPGDEPGVVVFTFQHRTREQLEAMFKKIAAEAEKGAGLDDLAMIRLVTGGWDLTDDFSDANITLLIENYLSAPKAIFDAYIDELTKGRAKN